MLIVRRMDWQGLKPAKIFIDRAVHATGCADAGAEVNTAALHVMLYNFQPPPAGEQHQGELQENRWFRQAVV